VLWLILKDQHVVEIPGAEYAVLVAEQVRCLDAEGRVVRSITAQDVLMFTRNSKVAEAIQSGGSHTESIHG
jgi:hypothetical protein